MRAEERSFVWAKLGLLALLVEVGLAIAGRVDGAAPDDFGREQHMAWVHLGAGWVERSARATDLVLRAFDRWGADGSTDPGPTAAILAPTRSGEGFGNNGLDRIPSSLAAAAHAHASWLARRTGYRIALAFAAPVPFLAIVGAALVDGLVHRSSGLPTGPHAAVNRSTFARRLLQCILVSWIALLFWPAPVDPRLPALMPWFALAVVWVALQRSRSDSWQ